MLKRIQWGGPGTLSDPRLHHLDALVRAFRNNGWTVPGWERDRFNNDEMRLPIKPKAYYYRFKLKDDSGKLRIVLGEGGEVYLSGDHYGDLGSGFRQVIELPD